MIFHCFFHFVCIERQKMMKRYLVEITETLQKQIIVSANSREEAEQKARKKYRNEEIVLYDQDYVDTDFHVIKEARINEMDER